jgi:hypothetical protein
VRFIDQQERVVLLLQLDDVGQWRFIAIHAEHGIDRDENALRAAILGLTETPLQVFHIVVTEAPHLALRHARAIVNALVRILVEQSDIARAEQ